MKKILLLCGFLFLLVFIDSAMATPPSSDISCKIEGEIIDLEYNSNAAPECSKLDQPCPMLPSELPKGYFLDIEINNYESNSSCPDLELTSSNTAKLYVIESSLGDIVLENNSLISGNVSRTKFDSGVELNILSAVSKTIKDGNLSENYLGSHFVNYRKNLIKYQPQFTVEGNKMITREVAIDRMEESRNTNYNLCSSGEGTSCNTLPTREQSFSTSEFQWYIWYEEVNGYSRYSPIKTFIAKFPINNDSKQGSYSLFSYQGFWQLRGVNNDIFRLFEYSNNLGVPDYTFPAMLFEQNGDFPLMFEEYISSRYGIGATTWCVQDDILEITRTTDMTLLGKYQTTKYSLITGEVIDKTDYETIDYDDFQKLQNECVAW